MRTSNALPSDKGECAPWTLYRPHQRWKFLAILFLVSTCNYADRQVISVLFEPIKREFNASDTMMGLLGGFAFAAFYAIMGIPVARLADRGNRKIIITISLAIWSAMTVLSGLARSFPQLLLARVGVGAGEAGAIPPAQSLIADYFPPDQRARALGVFMASATVGYLVAFIAGAQLASIYGWRTALVALGAPGLLLCVLTSFGLKEPRNLSVLSSLKFDESFKATLSTLAKKNTFVLMCITAVLYWIVAYGALMWFPSYLVRVMGQDLSSIGMIFGSTKAIAALIGAIFGGAIIDRVAKKSVKSSVTLSALLLIGAMPLFEFALVSGDLRIFYLAMFFGGVALNAAMPAMFSIVHRICGSSRRAMSVAIIFFFANLLGLGFGPLITGVLSDYLTSVYGAEGLRYALMISIAFLIPAGLTMWMASGSVERDAEA